MAHQPGGGGGGGGGGGLPDLNMLPGDDGEEEAPPPVDRISALSRRARQRVVSFLSLRAFARLALASRGWFAFFSGPQKPCAYAVAHRLRSAADAPRLIDELGRRRGWRLLRFFLSVECAEVRPGAFWLLLDHAAGCGVEDMFLDARRGPPGLCFSLRRASPRLVRLTLCGVRVTETRYPAVSGCSNPTLECLRIQDTSLEDRNLGMILLSCPRLRVLQLYRCEGLTCVELTGASGRLMSLTVSECPQVADISASPAHDLCSFRYRGDSLNSLALPAAAYFGDLYICFWRLKGPMPPSQNWLHALPDLSYLTILTLCSNALRQMLSALRKDGGNAQLARLSNLRSLRELQLIIYGLRTVNLSDIYGFLKFCSCSQLKKLFVQLPKSSKESYQDALRELREEAPEDFLENLVMVKITNFRWHCNEIELAHFLFRQASSLQKMILVVPQRKFPVAEDMLLLGNPPANAKILVLSESSGSKIRPFHRH